MVNGSPVNPVSNPAAVSTVNTAQASPASRPEGLGILVLPQGQRVLLLPSNPPQLLHIPAPFVPPEATMMPYAGLINIHVTQKEPNENDEDSVTYDKIRIWMDWKRKSHEKKEYPEKKKNRQAKDLIFMLLSKVRECLIESELWRFPRDKEPKKAKKLDSYKKPIHLPFPTQEDQSNQ
jgi:hypothetical protein